MRILLAEDDKISRELLTHILDLEQRHTLVPVTDGEAAWTKLREPEDGPFELLILDVMMPKLDGLSLLERLRGDAALKNTPVVLCTVSSDRNTVRRAAQLGVTHYIVKPYVKNLILEKIHQVENELSIAESLEPVPAVCQRLGIEPELHAKLTQDLLAEIRGWLATLRTTELTGSRDELLLGANGFKGSGLSLGTRTLVRQLGEVEELLQNPEVEKILPKITVLGNAIENELHLVNTRLQHLKKT